MHVKAMPGRQGGSDCKVQKVRLRQPAPLQRENRFTFIPWRWKQQVPTKCWHAYIKLYGVTSYSIFILHSVLRQVHSLFQTDFSTEWDLVLPPLFRWRSFSRCLRRTPRLSVTSICSSVRPFRMQFLPKICPIQLAILRFIRHFRKIAESDRQLRQVCPSVLSVTPYATTRPPRYRSSWNLHFSKICPENSGFIKIWQE